MTTIPLFPNLMFPNAVTVFLSVEDVNTEGGAGPVFGSGVDFNVSVQHGKAKWEGMGETGRSCTPYFVKFQADPTPLLARAIGPGDKLVYGDLALNVLGEVRPSGGYNWLWRLECEHVGT